MQCAPPMVHQVNYKKTAGTIKQKKRIHWLLAIAVISVSLVLDYNTMVQTHLGGSCDGIGQAPKTVDAIKAADEIATVEAKLDADVKANTSAEAELAADAMRKSVSDESVAESQASDVPWPGRAIETLNMTSADTLIVLIVSCPYLDMFDNALESMRKVGIKNIAIVPTDETARDVSRELQTVGVVLDVPGFLPAMDALKEHQFGSPEFKQFTASRPIILKKILQSIQTIFKGKDGVPSLFYSDIDTYFQHDPIPFFRRVARELSYKPDKQMEDVISNTTEENGFDVVMTRDGRPELCSCFIHLQATHGSHAILDSWTNAILSGRFNHDQSALHNAIGVMRSLTNATTATTSFRLLANRTWPLPCGKVFHKMDEGSRARALVVHNNYIIGHDNKVNRFKNEWHVWNPSRRMGQLRYQCGKPGVREVTPEEKA